MNIFENGFAGCNTVSDCRSQHFPYDDYDEWMWGNYGPWGEYSKEKRIPDILVVGGLGLHSCEYDNFYILLHVCSSYHYLSLQVGMGITR